MLEKLAAAVLNIYMVPHRMQNATAHVFPSDGFQAPPGRYYHFFFFFEMRKQRLRDVKKPQSHGVDPMPRWKTGTWTPSWVYGLRPREIVSKSPDRAHKL